MLATNKMILFLMIAISLLIVATTSLQAEEDKKSQATPYDWQGMPHAMQKAMQPNTWPQLVAIMMDPQNSSPISACALCHQGEDIARFQQYFGPMLEAMWQPYQSMMNPNMMASWMNPGMYMNMMYSMMGTMMNPVAMMNPMTWMKPAMWAGGAGYPSSANPIEQMMNPKQYEKWFSQRTETMNNVAPQAQQ